MQQKCPHCHRLLQVPEHLIGKKVRCTICNGIVDTPLSASAPPVGPAPAPPPPPGQQVVPVPPPISPQTAFAASAAPPAEPPASDDPFTFENPAAPAGDFAFMTQAQASDRGVRRRMRSAASFLLFGLGFAFFVNCVYAIAVVFRALGIREEAAYYANPIQMTDSAYRASVMGALVRVLVLAVTFLVPAIFVFMGARAMPALRSRGWAIGGAICSILLGLQGVGGVLRGIVLLLPGRSSLSASSLERALEERYFGFILLGGLLCLVQVILCIWAGVGALAVIMQPQAQEALRAARDLPANAGVEGTVKGR
jgi:hypothetical protein